MKKILTPILFAIVLLISGRASATATLIAGWDFQTIGTGGTAAAAAPSSPTVYAANFGSGNIYMNGTNNSSTWVTATTGNEVTSFGGSNLNTSGTSLSTVTSGTSALAILGGASGTTANGKFIVFKFTMTGYTNLVVSYASQKSSATGFSTHTWEYSTNGTTWTSVGTVSPTTSFAAYTLSTITGLDNAATAYLRMTPSGSSAAASNNRLDNIQLNATSAPTISVSALTAFGNVCTSSTAGPNSFTISGSNLTTANVTVGALSGYTYSTTSGGTYTSSLSLTQPGGTYSQQIFVKFNPALVQSYSGNIAVGGGGASSVNAAASGAGVNTAVAVTTGASSGITTTSATAAGTLTAGCTPVTAYGIEYSLTNNFTTGTGTQAPSSNLSAGAFSSSLTPLLPGTTYYYRAYATDGTGTVYGSQSSFLTTALVATLSSGSLAGFGTVCTGSTGGPNSFTITGSGLTTANVNVGPLSGYTFSTTSGGTYTSSLSLTQPGGSYSQAIYVDFSPSSATTYNGNIPVNGGGALLSSDVAVTGTGIAPPSQPSSIVGLAAPCKSTTGNTYSVTAVSGVTYTWTLPTGWVQTAGTNTNAITVTSGTTSGTITVTPNNGYCNGTAQTLAVAPVNIPSTPSAIVGSVAVCGGTTGLTYSVTSVAGITYTWVLPSGWTQTGGGTTNSITVTAGTTGGTITVTPANASCSGPTQSLVVAINALPAITSATSTTGCVGGPVTLTVSGSNFSDYRWSDPASSTSGLVYQQNFNSLPASGASVTWTDNSTIPGWYASSSNLASTGLAPATGSGSSGGLFSFGSASAADRALGSLASGSTGPINYGVRLNNSTGGTVNKIFVQYTGEQWRDGGSGAVANSLTFTYSTNATSLSTGTYTAATTLDYTTTVASGTPGALNGNANQTIKTATITLGTPLASGGSIWLKWTDIDNTGSDMGIALDDVTVIMYNSSSTLMATPAATVSTSTFGAGGSMTSGAYTAAAVTTPGAYNVVVSNAAGCTATSTTTVALNSPATAVANATGNATINNSATYTLAGSASNYTSYSWSANGTGVLSNTNTLTPLYDPAQGEIGTVTVTLTVVSLSPCASPVVDSMVLTITPAPGNLWIGNNSNWFDVSNWASGVIPNSCNAIATIPVVGGGFTYPVINATSPQVGTFTINSGAQVTINASKTLSICGNWTGGSSTTSASILGAGSVILNGTTAQTISGKTSFNTLTINKTAGTTSVTGTVDVHTALIMTRGDLSSPGRLTLKSDATGTAYLDNFTSGTAGTYTGSVTVERYVASSTIGYRDLSSPVVARVGQWSDNFAVTGADGVDCWYAYNPYPTLQYYIESFNSVTADFFGGFFSTTDIANVLTPMKGYAARIYNAPLTINTTGAPNNGAQSIGITTTPSSIPAADGWNLIGNPYPSSVKWSNIKAMNAGKTDGSSYTYTTTGEYTGNWATWNGTAGTNGATDEIASTQGFFVLASSNTTLNIDNTVRVAATASPFFKTRSVQPDEIRLNISNATQSDEIVAYTDQNATAGYDPGYDAVKIAAGSSMYMSFDMPGREYAINVLDAVTDQTELPLLIAVPDTGSYSITATELNLASLTAYLKDAQTNTFYDLSAGSVSLTLDGHRSYAGRFSVVFKKAATTGIATADLSGVKIYAYDAQVHVERSSSSLAVINISNILGQQITSVSTSQESTVIPMTATEPWYALVKVTEGNKVSVKKVLISNK